MTDWKAVSSTWMLTSWTVAASRKLAAPLAAAAAPEAAAWPAPAPVVLDDPAQGEEPDESAEETDETAEKRSGWLGKFGYVLLGAFLALLCLLCGTDLLGDLCFSACLRLDRDSLLEVVRELVVPGREVSDCRISST